MRAQAPRNSSSLEALERLPSLSLSRWIWKALRSPSGVQRGIRKQEMPESVWARTRKASHIGAEQNHLWPTSSYSAPGPPPLSGVADGGVGAHVGAALLLGHRHPAEGAALALGRQRALVVVEREEALLPLGGELGLLAQRRDRRVGHRDRAADAALGLHQQHEHRRRGRRGRRRPARARASRAGRGWSRSASARARSCRTRPRRCGGRSGRGCFSCGFSRWPRSPSGSSGREPQIAPSSRRRSSAQPAPSRSSASAAAGRRRTSCSPPAAAAWLKTSWVAATARARRWPCDLNRASPSSSIAAAWPTRSR